MISAMEAGQMAIRHMAELLNRDKDGKWIIDECQLAAFFHDSDWYPEGVHFIVSKDCPMVYRVVVSYKASGMLSKKEEKMIISVDAENGALRGYRWL